MREISDVVAGFPTVTFTAVLILMAGFWVRVLLDRSEHGVSRRTADADALGRDGVRAAARTSGRYISE